MLPHFTNQQISNSYSALFGASCGEIVHVHTPQMDQLRWHNLECPLCKLAHENNINVNNRDFLCRDPEAWIKKYITNGNS